MFPLCQMPGLLAVVCAVLSRFVQRTVLPWWITILSGTNFVFCMMMPARPTMHAPGAIGSPATYPVGAGVGVRVTVGAKVGVSVRVAAAALRGVVVFVITFGLGVGVLVIVMVGVGVQPGTTFIVPFLDGSLPS